MRTEEFIKWLQAGKAKPGTMQLNSAKWFGHFWVEGLDRKLDGTLCDVEGSKRPAGEPQADEADDFMSSLNAGMQEANRHGKRKRDDDRQEREAKRRKELQDLHDQLDEDPPEIASDTEHPQGDVEPFPRVLVVEASGSTKIDGAYRRYRSFSRGRPCYVKNGKHTQHLYWQGGRWRIGKDFGSKDSGANVKDFQEATTEKPCLPFEPYPSTWKVFQKDSSGEDAKKKAVLVSAMRVYEQAAQDVMYSNGALVMRQPVLREPFGISKKLEAGGSSSSKPSKSADASREKAPSPKKPAKVDTGSPGKSNDQPDKKQARAEARPREGPDSDSEEAADQASASSSSSSSASSESESENEDPTKDAAVADQGLAPDSSKNAIVSAESKFRIVMDQQFGQSSGNLDLLAQKLGKLASFCSDDDSYARMASQVPGVSRQRMMEIMEEYEIKYGVTQALKDKWYLAVAKGAGKGDPPRSTPKPPGVPPPHARSPKPPPGAPPPHLRQQQNIDSVPAPQTPPDEDVSAHKKWDPPNHRTILPTASCLKAKRLPVGRRRQITYKDGIFRGDEKGEALEERYVVVSHRISPELWYQQPGAQVICDRCQRVWPQSMGMLTGSPGMSQFAQNQFWCNECASMM
jgi:hypothetical protein